MKLKEQAREGKADDDGGLRFKDRWCLPVGEPTLKECILDKVHSSMFSIHHGGNKMYKDLPLIF